MKSRFVVSGRLATAVLFAFVSFAAAAQDNLDFIEPADNVKKPINYAQAVTVEWMLGDISPIRGPVALTTTLGTVNVAMQMTDDFGRATFIVSSDTPGIAMLEAVTATDTIDMQLNFVDPPTGSDLLDLAPYEPPHGIPSVMRTDENGRRYWLAKDRIVARIEPGVRVSDLEAYVNDNFVIDRFFISQSLMVLVFDETQRVTPLRKLAKELENLIVMHGTDSFDPVRKAGLLASLDHSQQAYMVPDQIIVRFVDVPDMPADLAAFEDNFSNDYRLTDLEQFSSNELRYLATVNIDDQPKDAIQLATDMSNDSRVANADPNFAPVMRPRSAGAGEPGFPSQWYHRNDGHDATEDADIDTDLAWHFTEGSSSTIIAVIDSGFDVDHPDLKENLDPLQLFDMVDSDPSDLLPDYLGFSAFAHGTHAAGVAGARGDNNRGYSGSCPQCRLLLIRREYEANYDQIIDVIVKAQNENANVLSMSWGFVGGDPAEEVWEVIQEAVDAGVTMVMAMTNENIDNCDSKGNGDYIDSSAHPAIIAVSGITDYDERSPYYGEAKGHGICMDVLAPTRGGAKGVHTTSVMMIDDEKKSTYWYDFGGTSAATPLVAGVIGLMKTLDPGLSPLKIQRILQDTADRVDPAHANYSTESGFSDPGGMPTHGYGRINAYEAVKLVAIAAPIDPDVPRGHEKMDLFLRDNATDWGNTQRSSDLLFDSPRSYYNRQQSVDIKIDVGKDDPPLATASDFSNFVGESPQSGNQATVYLRVRNRGPDPVPGMMVKLHAAVVDGALPPLPADFWTNYPIDSTDTTAWWTLAEATLTEDIPYSGASIAGCPRQSDIPPCDPGGTAITVTDPAMIVSLNVTFPDWDADSGQRLVLLAVVHHDDIDPVQGKLTGNPAFNVVPVAVAYDNNVTLWDPGYSSGGGGGFGILSLFTIFLIAGGNRILVLELKARDSVSQSLHVGVR